MSNSKSHTSAKESVGDFFWLKGQVQITNIHALGDNDIKVSNVGIFTIC